MNDQIPSRRIVLHTAGVFAVIAAIGWVDYITGPDIAFSLFYLLPVAASAWWLSPVTAWLAIPVAIAVWSAADIALAVNHHVPILVFNGATRAVILAGTVIAIGSVKNARRRERSEALEALQASESRFRNLVESTSDLVWEIDEQGRYTYLSPQAAQLLGYTPEELKGKAPFDLMPADESAHHRALFGELTRDPKPLVRLENVNLHKSGKQVILETSAMPISDAGGTFRGLRGIDRDITDRKRADEELLRVLGQLHQAQRLEAIGRLAGGVAHDFNNLLTVILGSADYLTTLVPADHPAHLEARAIFEAGQRGAKLTQQLLAFGRRQVRQARPIDLNRVLSDMHGLLRRLIGEHIQLELALAPDAMAVSADPAQIEQVVANLAANARDAMPQGGTLTIGTRLALLDQRAASDLGGLIAGEFAVLSVSDTGVGIAPDVQQHLFEPFFTTKGRASGTGLGLATVHAVVEQSGGRVSVKSVVGKGSTFEILLPRIAGAPEAAPAPETVPASTTGSETVLVAEDEQAVRHLLTRYLSQSGYTVIVGSTPEEAFQLATDAGHIDLLVTDVIMPGMSGPELANRLLTSRPALKVLFVSGYPDGVLAQHGIVSSGIQLLQKPFSRDTLVRRVRSMLDSGRAAPRAATGSLETTQAAPRRS